MTQETQDKLREIKGRFRLMMNGVVSQSMRDKGLNYKLNWGISLPVLKDMAKDYGKDFHLAIELWKEDIRECRILATMIMPSEEMDACLTDVWVSDVRNQELAVIASLNLFQYVSEARGFAFSWIAADNELRQLCGYSVLARLFMRGEQLDIREIHEYFDQSQTALYSSSAAVQRAVVSSLARFAEIGNDNSRMVNVAFKSVSDKFGWL